MIEAIVIILVLCATVWGHSSGAFGPRYAEWGIGGLILLMILEIVVIVLLFTYVVAPMTGGVHGYRPL